MQATPITNIPHQNLAFTSLVLKQILNLQHLLHLETPQAQVQGQVLKLNGNKHSMDFSMDFHQTTILAISMHKHNNSIKITIKIGIMFSSNGIIGIIIIIHIKMHRWLHLVVVKIILLHIKEL